MKTNKLFNLSDSLKIIQEGKEELERLIIKNRGDSSLCCTLYRVIQWSGVVDCSDENVGHYAISMYDGGLENELDRWKRFDYDGRRKYLNDWEDRITNEIKSNPTTDNTAKERSIFVSANELRLGVLVLNRHNEIHIVNENTFQDFRYPRMDGNYGYSGIPLTEEWLLKFGFIKNNTCYVLKFGSNCITISLFKKPYSYLNGTYISDRTQYVHQLQNLYFALTGEELIWQ
jgi:hypothetical protein